MEQNAGKSPTEGGMPPTLKKGEGKKTTVRLLFLVFLIVVLGVFWYSAKNNQMPEEEAANMDNNQEARKIELKGIIAWTEGTVERKVDDQWQQAGAEAELSAGDELRVSGEGRAVIALDDGSLIRLDSDTTITLSELDSEKINLTNDKGELYARVAGGGPEFNVKIDEVVFTAEGTAFKVTNLDDKKDVEVYESKVKILNEGDKDVLVDQGKKYYLKDKDNEDQEKTVTDLSKTDLSKDEFILWNKAEDAKLDAYKEKLGF